MTKRPTNSTKAFTTKPVLDGEPVVWVCHDEDGDWQFFGETEVDEEDGRIVHLGHLLDRQESLRRVLDLPIGHAATWNEETSDWDVAAEDDGQADENAEPGV